MGITNLLPFVKKACRPCDLPELAGGTAGVDVLCWLHRGAYACADALATGKQTDVFVTYCVKYVKLLRSHNIRLVVVFDGAALPSKAGTEQKRKEDRRRNKAMGMKHLAEGRANLASDCFKRSIQVTQDMKLQVMQELRKIPGVDCLVAPYESDAQLAYLSMTGVVDFVITEDSDLIPFGCEKVGHFPFHCQELRKIPGVDCLVAPYESDAQLAYLSMTGVVDFVITEDSDLIPFGCEKVGHFPFHCQELRKIPGVDCLVAPYESDAQLAYLSMTGVVDFVITEDSDLIPFGCEKVGHFPFHCQELRKIPGVDCLVAPYESDAQLAYLSMTGVVDFVITEDSDLIPFGCEKVGHFPFHCQELRKIPGVDCLVAPYESDAQLAYLSMTGVVDFVITEDSDLIPFGCEKILFKLDFTGRGSLYAKKDLPKSLGQETAQFSFTKFRRLCILSGCDYLDSLPGIGLAKAAKFFAKTINTDLNRTLKKVPSYLNMSKLSVSQEYIDAFIQAERTFLYQVVFDAVGTKQRHLHHLQNGLKEEQLVYAGIVQKDNRLALQIALGNVNPRDCKTVLDNFDPANPQPSTGMTALPRCSIWHEGGKRGKKHATLNSAFQISPVKRPVRRSILHDDQIITSTPRKPGTMTIEQELSTLYGLDDSGRLVNKDNAGSSNSHLETSPFFDPDPARHEDDVSRQSDLGQCSSRSRKVISQSPFTPKIKARVASAGAAAAKFDSLEDEYLVRKRVKVDAAQIPSYSACATKANSQSDTSLDSLQSGSRAGAEKKLLDFKNEYLDYLVEPAASNDAGGDRISVDRWNDRTIGSIDHRFDHSVSTARERRTGCESNGDQMPMKRKKQPKPSFLGELCGSESSSDAQTSRATSPVATLEDSFTILKEIESSAKPNQPHGNKRLCLTKNASKTSERHEKQPSKADNLGVNQDQFSSYFSDCRDRIDNAEHKADYFTEESVLTSGISSASTSGKGASSGLEASLQSSYPLQRKITTQSSNSSIGLRQFCTQRRTSEDRTSLLSTSGPGAANDSLESPSLLSSSFTGKCSDGKFCIPRKLVDSDKKDYNTNVGSNLPQNTDPKGSGDVPVIDLSNSPAKKLSATKAAHARHVGKCKKIGLSKRGGSKTNSPAASQSSTIAAVFAKYSFQKQKTT